MLTGLGHHLKSHPVMLKKTLLALICLSLSLTGTAAQLTATLQSGDNFTPFYGANALVEAHNAAVNGDIITLSPGEFKTDHITKSVTIIGSYGFGEDTSKCTKLITCFRIVADNVTLEGIRTDSIRIWAADNITISRSSINCLLEKKNNFDGGKLYHNNTILTDCLISSHQALYRSTNMVMRNCCINCFEDCNKKDNLALIENCNIPLFHKYNDDRYRQPYAIYRSCFLGLYKKNSSPFNPVLSFDAPTEFHEVFFYQNFVGTSGSSDAKYYNLSFGSCMCSGIYNFTYVHKFNVTTDSEVGMYGSFSNTTYKNIAGEEISFGPKDHKSEPAIPAITSSQIDTETDAEGKLHVKISATARD